MPHTSRRRRDSFRPAQTPKLEVAAEKEVRIASAQATASLFTKMEAKLFGTPEEVNKLLSSVLGGQSAATTANAFLAAADPKTTRLVDGLTRGLGGLAEAASKRLTEAGSSDPTTESDRVETGNDVATRRDDFSAVDDDEIEDLDSANDAPEAPAA